VLTSVMIASTTVDCATHRATPSWFGTMNNTVSAAFTASSVMSPSAMRSNSPAYVLPKHARTP
jgi:hypothetical protein